MNAKSLFAAVVIVVLGGSNSVRSAPFANLDFEDAIVPGDVLPNWSVNNLGPSYNLFCLGSSCVSVHDMGSPAPLEGEFSVFLQGGTSGFSGELPLIGAAISQTGDVPLGAKESPDINVGPSAAFGGNDRERPSGSARVIRS